MSTPSQTNNNTASESTSDTGNALIPQSWKDDPALLQKLLAGLALVDSAKGTGLAGLMNVAIDSTGKLLNTDTGNQTTPDTTLFKNSNSNDLSNFYKITNGWGVEKQGSKINTFEYEVISNNGLVDRVFGPQLNDLESAVADALAAAEDEAKIEFGILPVAGADVPAYEAFIDRKTAPARENLAHLIVAAYTYIVDAKPDDLVSYVSLANKAMKAWSYEVRNFLETYSKGLSYIPGVALAMVVDTVATGSVNSIKRKAIKPFKESTLKSKIVELKEFYTQKVYKKLKPKVELEAEIEEAGLIGGNWAVDLTAQAQNMEDFRAMDFEVVEKAVASALESDRQKIFEMFAGTRGGGDAPAARKNLVEAGVDVKIAVELEKAAKAAGKKPEDQDEGDIWKSLQSTLKTMDKNHQNTVDKIIKAYSKTNKTETDGEGEDETESGDNEDGDENKDNDNKADAAKSDNLVELLTSLAGEAGLSLPVSGLLSNISALAGPAGLAIEMGKVVQSIADENEKQLKEDIAESEEARRSAMEEAEKILEDMKGSTEEDLEVQQKKLQNILTSVKRPANFGKSRMRGMASLQNELQMMSTKFGDTTMATLKPYNSYQKLVAGANGGKALKAVALFSERDEPITTASRTLLQIPTTVSMTSPDLPFRTTIHRTTSETEMNAFIKSTENSGLSTASKMNSKKSRSSAQSFNLAIVAGERRNTNSAISQKENGVVTSNDKNVNEELSNLGTEAVVSEFTFMPMKSFFLEERGLRLTNFAFTKFQLINTPQLARKFIKTFGSHVPFGTQTMGGIFVRTMKITSSQKTKISTLYQAAATKLSTARRDAAVGKDSSGINVQLFGLGGGANTAGESSSGSGTESTSSATNAGGSGNQSEANMATFDSNVICFGPKAATPDGLYQQLMRNNATWTIIDRGETSSYLPVWELIEFHKGTEQFKDQVSMLKTTWEQMALENHRPQDIDLLSEVMDEAPKTQVLQIVAKLALCIVPKNGNEYNTALADKLETILRNANQSVGEVRPRNLKHFVSKGNDDSFDVVETNDYEDADYIFSQLETTNFKLFEPSTGTDGSPAFNPYMKSKKWIVSRGKYDDDHLLEACISTVTQPKINFEFFSKLFDYYSGRGDEDTLRKQLYTRDYQSGMYCLHYVAMHGDESEIVKLLDKYDENAVEELYDYDGNNALKYLQERDELAYFVAELMPEEENLGEVEKPSTPTVTTKTMKDKIKESFDNRKKTLESVERGTKSHYKSSDSRRNRLAKNAATSHLSQLNDILGRINTSTKGDNLLMQYARDEVEKARRFAASEETRFSKYVLRYDNEYVQYVHRKAKDTFGRIKGDIDAF